MSFSRAAALLLIATPAWAGVVVNEILYHAPDDLDALQFIELHNPEDRPADLAGWRLTKGVKFTFPAGTTIPAGGFLVVCKDLAAFKTHYRFDATGPFEGSLAHDKGTVELVDAKGKKVDSVKYRSRAPWPLAPDGLSSSLERICPNAPGDDPANWAPSPLATPKVGGTPGKKNVNHAPTLPPAVSDVAFPAAVGPDQDIKVEATVRSATTVELLYRVAGSGYEKDETTLRMSEAGMGRFTAKIPAQKAGQIVRFRVRAVDAKKAERLLPNPNEVRPAFSTFVHDKLAPGKIPLGLVIHVGKKEYEAARRGADFGRRLGAPPAPALPARGASAYVHVDPKTGKPELFDFIQVTPRTGGRKIHFHKDHPLDGMRTVHLMFEWNERFALAEPLSFAFHRQAGNAAPRTDHVRTSIDGREIGYQLLVEQPNKGYLKHNGLKTDGNLYKAQWTGWTPIARHEKKTHVHAGHDDLVALLARINADKGEKQWEVIRKEFDAEQVVNHYAARMILSDWDGFFNNYFLYHDVGGTGKWTLHPWDQDKAWGYHDGVRGFDVFHDMPITFGMQGDKPPGSGAFGFGGPGWWRPGGDLSRPLLANPTFRKLFLARTKQLLETTYNEKVMFPRIKALGERLEEEVRVRAKIHGEDPKAAVLRLEKNLDSLRTHVKKRGEFLLAQDEIKKAGPFDRKDTK